MHLQQLSLTTVSNVSHISSQRGRFTEFDFTSSDAKACQAKAFGHLSPKANATLTLAMPGKDRWREIYGWLDHSSMQVVAPYFWERTLVLLVFGALSLALLIVFLGGAWSLRPSSFLSSLCFLFLALWQGFSVFLIVQDFLVAHAARKSLRALAASLTASNNVE